VANAVIIIPPDSTGSLLDCTSLAVGANPVVLRERHQLAGAAADDLAVVTDTDPAASDHGLVVRQAPPIDPQTSTTSSVAVAAGGSADLDSTQISSGKTGKLFMAEATASVPVKATLKTVLDGVVTATIGVEFGWMGKAQFTPPHKNFVTVAESATPGLDGFRLTVDNLDASRAADLHVNFMWDET